MSATRPVPSTAPGSALPTAPAELQEASLRSPGSRPPVQPDDDDDPVLDLGGDRAFGQASDEGDEPHRAQTPSELLPRFRRHAEDRWWAPGIPHARRELWVSESAGTTRRLNSVGLEALQCQLDGFQAPINLQKDRYRNQLQSKHTEADSETLEHAARYLVGSQFDRDREAFDRLHSKVAEPAAASEPDPAADVSDDADPAAHTPAMTDVPPDDEVARSDSWMEDVHALLGVEEVAHVPHSRNSAENWITTLFPNATPGLRDVLIRVLMNDRFYRGVDGDDHDVTLDILRDWVEEARRLEANFDWRQTLKREILGAVPASVPLRQSWAFRLFALSAVLAIAAVGWVFFAAEAEERSYQAALDRAAQSQGFDSHQELLERVGYTSKAQADALIPLDVKRARDDSAEALRIARGELTDTRAELSLKTDQAASASASAADAATSAAAAGTAAAAARDDAAAARRDADAALRDSAAARQIAAQASRDGAGWTTLVNALQCRHMAGDIKAGSATLNRYGCGPETSLVRVLCRGDEAPKAAACYVEP